MIKSMTGYSKSEAGEKGIKAIVELKSLNGRYLELGFKLPKSLNHKEFELRDIIKANLERGTISITVTIEREASILPFSLNEEVIANCYKTLSDIRTKLKIKDPVSFDNILHFSSFFFANGNEDLSDIEWKVTQKAVREGLKILDIMRNKEGKQLEKDISQRIKNITKQVEKIDELGAKRIPEERERLRQRVAMLFESDEIDERRLQMELVIMADKLDISEECVRLHSHLKFINEAIKAKEPAGRKITFLLQEIHREINTIGSKADDAEISQIVVGLKEEIEKIREQSQNIE
jgi:uncharacterized protein (TIGR00255 family)